MPHSLAERLAALRNGQPTPPDPREEVRDLVLLVSSSRGGSSIFAEVLRRLPGTLHLRAEVNPFLRVAGFDRPHSGEDSDALTARSRGDADLFACQLAWDIGAPARHQADLDRDLAWRLRVQWPGLPLDNDALLALIAEVPGDLLDDPVGFHIALLRRLRQVWSGVNPHFYDLDRGALGAAFADVPTPAGPPGAQIIEEPPFVAIGPWRRASAEELRSRPLVIKAPSNAYRLGWYRAMFPKARIRLLHLVRNPAAAINGLFDGWRSTGFHAHQLQEPLRIQGYTDHQPASARWWKYDLPPGWREYTQSPLVDVCAFQWLSAHTAILRGAEGMEREVFAFEEFTHGAEARVQLLARVSQWLGAPASSAVLDGFREPPPTVMSTARPRLQRWFARRAEIEPVVRRADIYSMAQRLGYGEPGGWT